MNENKLDAKLIQNFSENIIIFMYISLNIVELA